MVGWTMYAQILFGVKFGFWQHEIIFGYFCSDRLGIVVVIICPLLLSKQTNIIPHKAWREEWFHLWQISIFCLHFMLTISISQRFLWLTLLYSTIYKLSRLLCNFVSLDLKGDYFSLLPIWSNKIYSCDPYSVPIKKNRLL